MIFQVFTYGFFNQFDKMGYWSYYIQNIQTHTIIHDKGTVYPSNYYHAPLYAIKLAFFNVPETEESKIMLYTANFGIYESFEKHRHKWRKTNFRGIQDYAQWKSIDEWARKFQSSQITFIKPGFEAVYPEHFENIRLCRELASQQKSKTTPSPSPNMPSLVSTTSA